MSQTGFVDHYEALELSPNASTDIIERTFRYLASKYHPDVSGPSGKKHFNKLVEAYQILRNNASRAEYDLEYYKNKDAVAQVDTSAEVTGDDCVDRFRMLTLFYSQRRRDMKNPGVGIMKVSQIIGCPMDVLEFHLWYFREKGWISREESGLLSITAEGVDEIEQRNQQMIKDRLITHETGDYNAEPGLIPASS